MAPSFKVHGLEWRDQDVLQPIGGPVPRQTWSVRSRAGDAIVEGGNSVGHGRSRTPLDYFLAVFPPQELSLIAELISAQLFARRRPPTSPGEILKLFGVLLIGTRFEFGSRADLWSKSPRTKHMPAPAFGVRTGMPRNRFDYLWNNIKFSVQPAAALTAGATGAEQFRWSLVNDFVTAINQHLAAHVTPADTLCVHESISKWYGQGGDWISLGMPMYVAIEPKPENGCEIQNVACGRSGIMLRLKIVTTAVDQAANLSDSERGLLHGTAVLQRLVAPWAGSKRIVCADSYFACVEAAEELRTSGLRFIGVVKTAHRRFPMASLSGREPGARGDHATMAHVEEAGTPDMMTVLWVDRSRRYFVATAGSTRPGKPCERLRWRKTPAGAQRVAVTVPQPEVTEIYYTCAAKIDQHNRCRQADLRLEHKFGTHDWSQRVNISLLGMCTVDAWFLHTRARGPSATLKRATFYEELATGLIDKKFDASSYRLRGERAAAAGAAAASTTDEGSVACGVGTHLTPTTKRRKSSAAEPSLHLVQRDGRVCKQHRSSLVCSTCHENSRGDEIFVCGPRTGRNCFALHLRGTHDTGI